MAPLLPETRSQATTRVARSQTKLNTSSNRRSGSLLAHRCSFNWCSSTRRDASPKVGHDGAPLFNGDLLTTTLAADHAAALPHARGSPTPGVLRRLRHDPMPSAGVAPAPGPGRLPVPVGRHRAASHVHWHPFRRGSAPSYTPVASPRAAHRSLGPGLPPPKSHRRRKRAGQNPRPAQHHTRPIRQIPRPPTTDGASATGSVALRLPVLASGHKPSGSTGPPLPCRGCSRPHPQPGARPASSFNRSLR